MDPTGQKTGLFGAFKLGTFLLIIFSLFLIASLVFFILLFCGRCRKKTQIKFYTILAFILFLIFLIFFVLMIIEVFIMEEDT